MAKYQRDDDRITGKIVLRGTLTNTSPLLIGKGEGERSDAEVIKLPDGQPYVPASAIVGVLKTLFDENADLEQEEEKAHAEYFWGSKQNTDTKKSGQVWQSHIAVEDLLPVSASVNINYSIRDGVKIDNATGVAQTGSKYDYEILEPGTAFSLTAEVTIRNGMSADIFQKFVQFIIDELTSEELSVGALGNFGFGKLKATLLKVQKFDFIKSAEDAANWFQFLQTGQLNGPEWIADKRIKRMPKQAFTIDMGFRLKSSLMIGAYGVHSEDADKTHLTSRGKPVLTGKSIKGALRHRALLILQTQGYSIDETNKFLQDMMGWVDTKNGRDAKPSRLRIEEIELNGVKHILQDRIKIDRFTGGTLGGAKFDSQAVWQYSNEDTLLKMHLKGGTTAEKALLLHLIKDLWTSDLAIGGEKNIGRGVLQGTSLTVCDNGETIINTNSDGGLIVDAAQAKHLNQTYSLQKKTA